MIDMDEQTRHRRGAEEELEQLELEPRLSARDLLRLHPRLLLAAGIGSIIMFPLGLFLAAVGIGVLKVSGGAATDTSVVVAIAGFAVADFWAGGAIAALTRARAPQVAVAWGIARFVVLLLVALAAPRLFTVLPIQLLIAPLAAWAGAKAARKQLALRRQIRAERAAAGTVRRRARESADALH